MSELSLTPHERARKAYGTFLAAMQEPGTGRRVAQAMGVSESTVSRLKADVEDALVLVYVMGFELVTQGTSVDDARYREALETMAFEALRARMVERYGSAPVERRRS